MRKPQAEAGVNRTKVISNYSTLNECFRLQNKFHVESYVFFVDIENYTIILIVTFTSHIINDKFALHFNEEKKMGLEILIPIIVPVSVFVWLYFESKDKNKTILEISKNIDDPSKVEDLIGMLDERKKEPIDYRRTGVITLFTGVGLFLFGVFFLGDILKGVGALVAAIGAGQILAGYLYPRESEEIGKAVEKFEKK
jgi:hypothetical protein